MKTIKIRCFKSQQKCMPVIADWRKQKYCNE